MRSKLASATTVLTLAAILGCGDGRGAQAPSAGFSMDVRAPLPPQPATATSTVVFPMVPQPACVLRASGGIGPMSLSLHGQRLASLPTEVQWAEAYFAAGQRVGTIVGRTSTFDFAGEVSLTDVSYVPATRSMQDGWITIEEVRASEVTPAGEIVGSAIMPRIVVASSSRIPTRHPCDQVRLGWNGSMPLSGDVREIRRGAKGTLRDEPNGRALARIEVPPMPGPGYPSDHYAPFYVTMLEQRGAMARIAIRDMGVSVQGWTEASLLGAARGSSSPMQLGQAYAAGGSASSGGTKCSRPVAFFVRDGGRPVMVGAIRPGAEIRRAIGAPAGQGEMPIDVWGFSSTGLVPFVIESELASCNTPPSGGVVAAVPGRGLVLGHVEEAPPASSVPPVTVLPTTAPLPAATAAPDDRTVQGPKGDVFIGSITAPTPQPDREGVLQTLRPRLRSCYQRGLEADPTMNGKLVIQLLVGAYGLVVSSTPTSNTGLSPTVVNCVSNVLHRAQFQPNGPPTILVPLTFVQMRR